MRIGRTTYNQLGRTMAWLRKQMTSRPPSIRPRAGLILLGLGLAPALGSAACQTNAQEWPEATPASVGLDADLMEDLRQDLHEGAFRNTHSLLVIKNGRLVMEEYLGEMGRDDLHYTASVTKSVATLLLGIAMDRGLLPSLEDGVLDTPLSRLIPDYATVLSSDPRKAGMSLRDVLSMSGGLEWDEDSHPYDDPRNDWVRVRDADDPLALILQQPMAGDPGEQFVYSGGMSTIVGFLLDKATGGEPLGLVEEELFKPLGIDRYRWWNLEGGLIDAPGGLHLRPRDMAKIGQLMLNGGVWDGRQVVSEQWVTETSKRHWENSGSPDYALHWWCGDFSFRGRSTFLYMASGHGGQKIYVVPEFEMVIVLTHQVFDNPFGEMNNLAILSRYLFPGADPTAHEAETISLSQEALAAYAGEFNAPNGDFRIEVREGGLYLTGEGSPPLFIEPVGPTRFLALVDGLLEVVFEFELDGEGIAQRGHFSFGYRDDAFERAR